MDLKCILCGQDAQFLVKGDSLCRKHLPEDVQRKLDPEYDVRQLAKKVGLR